MDKASVVKAGAVASASMCAVVAGVVLAQYIFTVKKKTGRKTKIIEMVSLLIVLGMGGTLLARAILNLPTYMA